jgi:hypothetical protein
VPAALPAPGRANVALDQGGGAGNRRRKIRAVRPYWIRYPVAFWAWEKLKWAKDNVLLAIVSSLAPGLISAGIGAALSDHKWRAAAYATLSTYAGLFALFLMWRLVATPLELDRERQRFIDGLKQRLASTKVKLAALQVAPPAVDVELLEIHLQAADTALDHVPIFLSTVIFFES